MKKILLTIVSLATFIGAGTFVYKDAIAQTDTVDLPPFMQIIAERFGLGEEDLQEFINEERNTHQEQVRKGQEERLSEAVSEGVITQEQKEAIAAKRAEMQAEREQNREEHREKMDAWMEQNGIDHKTLQEVMSGFGNGFGKHSGARMGNCN